ncbi:DUF1508 domain-containing protein [Pseudarthrobacter sp. C4D7]|uniref:YegP family protein n=1 Tax=Pseudarthrobacter sp. C4D7 TaxID=2735268 RepID=UPI00158594B8|nr:DUF1508 domain-containing protein [Pseudarthrobacter sp. C4D7]NUT72639.1 DUF1508 domain-containing protein [Pseudarthrobacter sp. C4D7]
MAGTFEAFIDADAFFRFRLLAPDGAVIAVSGPFEDKAAVVAGIAAVRECAGTGLVTDLCPAGTVSRPAAAPAAAAAAVPAGLPTAVVPPCGEELATSPRHPLIPAGALRRYAAAPRWTRAATR